MRLTPAKLKELCQQYNLTPSKKYGQNFLIQEYPIKKIIEVANINKNDTVIEIGSGFGILTFALAERAGRVIGLEIERKLEDYWNDILKTKKINDKMINDNIEIVWGNALAQISNFQFPISNFKVVANIPYQITSQILRTLLELENKPESITIMVQKEVAERICAKPGDMSLLAVSVQYYGEPKIVDIVTKGNFWPEPKVDSAILHIDLTKSLFNPPLGRGGDFFRVVKLGFAQKRKQLWGNLSKGLKINGESVKKVLLEVTGNEKIRAEELNVEQWKKIIEKLGI